MTWDANSLLHTTLRLQYLITYWKKWSMAKRSFFLYALLYTILPGGLSVVLFWELVISCSRKIELYNSRSTMNITERIWATPYWIFEKCKLTMLVMDVDPMAKTLSDSKRVTLNVGKVLIRLWLNTTKKWSYHQIACDQYYFLLVLGQVHFFSVTTWARCQQTLMSLSSIPGYVPRV